MVVMMSSTGRRIAAVNLISFRNQALFAEFLVLASRFGDAFTVHGQQLFRCALHLGNGTLPLLKQPMTALVGGNRSTAPSCPSRAQNWYSAGVMPLARRYISAEARWCVV